MIDIEQVAAVVSSQASRYKRLNPSVEFDDLRQEAWLRVLSKCPEHEGNAHLQAKKACAKQVAFDRSQVSVPWQYLFDTKRNNSAKLGNRAFVSLPLDAPMPDGGGSPSTWGSLLEDTALLPSKLASLQQVLNEVRARCSPSQRLVLDRMLLGYSQVELAAELGYSRAKISLDFIALLELVEDVHSGKPAKAKPASTKPPQRVVPSTCADCGCAIVRKRWVEYPVCKDCRNAERRAIKMPRTEAQKLKHAEASRRYNAKKRAQESK